MKVQPPGEIIFFVTSRCNLRCKHCFNWGNLQRNRDLSLAEIETLAKSLTGLHTLSLSGGEPFLRKDLVQVLSLFTRHCPIKMIDIPSSGTLAGVTVTAVEEILKLAPSFRLSVGISFDGMESYHDANRGVPGTFAKAVACCEELLELKKRSKRLSVNVLTTLVRDNRTEIQALKGFVAQRLPGIDHLSCVIARGDLKEGSLGLIAPEDLDALDRELLEFNYGRKKPRERAVADRFQMLRREAFLKQAQPVPCMAGREIAVVYDDGSVAPCEMLPAVGNLRDAGFGDIWNGAQMNEARASIGRGGCACTHECFLSPSYARHVLGRPAELVRLEGAYGLYHYLYAVCGLNLPVRAARKLLGRLAGSRNRRR